MNDDSAKLTKEQCEKWQETFLTISCDKLSEKKREDYFKMECVEPLFLCGQSSKCPNSTSPLQEYLSLHFQDDCFNATAEEEGQIKAKILENYGGCDQFNASLLEPCRSSSESAHLTMAPFFMLFFMLFLFK
ncbi:Oidioi.mRNA.OKI2018_I69.chr1.g2889.t1.cds [Oikopleura dioica]|uniref:Oidioi.mRNA.OKI2018_I69.chr1.g2889.t1.cds n=1 Tax=Oikopleura dioica TaxID=34765 RepID=A0ABN7SVZ0_OIKDI|nr:Oidioi.mRNA.OKI2018_I69.chr1.g2889.t1.cds [Oikopleura dioica]